MPRVLFIHNGSPGRFMFLNKALGDRGWERAHIGAPDATDLPGARNFRWKQQRGSTPGIFNPATRAEVDIMRGVFAAQVAQGLKADGFVPDLIVGHPGWGEMTFLHEVFPGVKQIQIGEFFYRSKGADVDFDPEFPMLDFESQVRVHAKNAVITLSHTNADRIVCPTAFQASLFPPVLQHAIEVIHEGVDTQRTQRIEGVSIKSGDRVIDGSRPVITFINRAFEPMRGFHTFMRALPHYLDAVPDADVILVGTDRRETYGPPPVNGNTWKEVLMREVGHRLDMKRVHFPGGLAYDSLLRVLSLSWAHVYMTYPFVLSWSLLDAMACECVMVASDTAPVRDAIRDGENGVLVDFFDHEALAAKLVEISRNPAPFQHLRKAARQSAIASFDRATICEPAWLRLVDEVMASLV